MSKVFRAVGAVASIVALVPGPWQAPAAIVAVVANVGAALTQTKPPAQGGVTEVRIGPNLPTPYAMGRTYAGGNREHDVGYGGTVSDVKNPYRAIVDVWSLGPVQSIEAYQADFTTIPFSGTAATGYYANFLYLSKQLGALPEASALTGNWGTIPSWGSSSKLSGKCAGLTSLKFDKNGKVYASGVPLFGAILNGVKVYDPRQDSTYPGGSGAARAKNESTYVGGAAAENPGCHGVTYALGRYQNGKKVFGGGFATDAIDWAAWVAFANHCDANGWKVGGVIHEPGSRWDNLKRICEAGGGEPVFVGAKLSVRWSAPKISVDTITADDLADGEITIPAMRTWRDRKNIFVPRYRSEAHKWEYVQAEAVEVEDYIDEDGEEKPDEAQFDLVQWVNQATQLAAYKLVDAREITGIVIPCKPRLINYQLGEALTVDLPEEGLSGQLCEIIGRSVDPGTAIVTLTLRTETNAKHDFALGLTGTAPPTPSLTTAEDLDDIVFDGQYRSAPIEVATEAAMLALDVAEGVVAIRTDIPTTFIRNGNTYTGTLADWTEALSPTVPADGTVTNAKLADMAQATIKGRAAGAGTGDPTDLTGTQTRAILSMATTDAVTFESLTLNSTGLLTVGGASTTLSAINVKATAARPYAALLTNRGAGRTYGIAIDVDAVGDGKFGLLDVTAGAVRLSIDTAGAVTVPGQMIVGSFRINAAPTAAAVAQTHHVPININGVTYKLLLAS